jgi:hypothetical protein
MHSDEWRRARHWPADRCRLTRHERRALRRMGRRLSAEDPVLAELLQLRSRLWCAWVWTGTALLATAVVLDEGLLMLASVLVFGVPVGRWFTAWAGLGGRDQDP